MARTRRQARDAEAEEVRVERRVIDAQEVHIDNLVQTALAGEAGQYVTPDHQPGESFPGRQASTTQLSLFETGFKRKPGQLSLFQAGLKRRCAANTPELWT
jgi:hypothetical protein